MMEAGCHRGKTFAQQVSVLAVPSVIYYSCQGPSRGKTGEGSRLIDCYLSTVSLSVRSPTQTFHLKVSPIKANVLAIILTSRSKTGHIRQGTKIDLRTVRV